MKIVLNESQIDRIADTVNKSGISSAELKENLIDHLCCMAEDEMSKGKDFETVYKDVFQRVSPKGLDEIENETLFLLTSKSRKRLKRFTNISGRVTATLCVAAAIMKVMHFPFAQIVFLAAMFCAIIVFSPGAFVSMLKWRTGKSKFSNIVIFSGAILLLISLMFWLLHWPLSQSILLMGVGLIYVGLFPLLFYNVFRKKRQANSE
jgi:hypothetical protein